MTPLRRNRLLLIAQRPNPSTQKWYSQYCRLQGEGLTGWAMGFAYLTDMGREYISK